MKIPPKIKIGAYDYKVEFKKGIKDQKGGDAWGLCDWHDLVIYLDGSLKGKRLVEVFIHECLHAIEESYDIKLGERKVNMLGLALTALIKDNKLRF